MRKLLIVLSSCFLNTVAFSQETIDTSANAVEEIGDTTIYQVVEEMPRFPACETLDTTIEFKNFCSQQRLLAYMYDNIIYPLEARRNGNEGSVVISFVVEKNGFLTQPKILKDIGGGCAIEAIRVLGLLNQQGIRWVPGKHLGEAVRTRYNLPIKFKLQEPPPYSIVGRDTVYTEFDTPLEFEGGTEALTTFINEKLENPKVGEDSCMIGTVDLQILVDPEAKVRILNITDYSGLGIDFAYEAIDATTSSIGRWKPAVFEGRKVPAAYDLSVTFVPSSTHCQSRVEEYNQSVKWFNEGVAKFDEGEESRESGIELMSKAVNLFPNNTNFLIARGQAYMDINKMSEACEDLSKVRDIALINWYDDILDIICKIKN